MTKGDDPKPFWWLVLGLSLGPALLSILTMASAILDGETLSALLSSIWFLVNVAVVWHAIRKLNGLYIVEPAWDGKWQLSLGDLISVAFVAGFMMAFCRSVAPQSFRNIGITVSLCITAGYLISLLLQSRMGDFVGWKKWVGAIYFLVAAACILPGGILLQIFVFGLFSMLVSNNR